MIYNTERQYIHIMKISVKTISEIIISSFSISSPASVKC